MEDNSFLYFTNNDVLSNIDIDPRLIDSFKRVLNKIQVYFNSNGYTKQRDYKDFLEKNLLNGFRIYVDKIEKGGLLGFYDKYGKSICINEKILGNPNKLDSTLCHEFIHFLVMHGLKRDECDDQIFFGGFVNEALTEMLTQQMFPNVHAYDAQVSMMKFANLLSGNVNNYSLFLKGYIDSRLCSSSWKNFIECANKFQKDFESAGYINLKDASSNKNFLSAQRYLISLFINTFESRNFSEYCDCIRNLYERPVSDQEYINSLINSLDRKLLRDLKIDDSPFVSLFIQKLKEVRDLINDSTKYDGKDVYEFEFSGEVLAIDSDLNFYGSLIGGQRSWNPKIRVMEFKKGNEFLSLNVDEIDFEKRSVEIQKKLDDLSLIFSKDLSKNLSMLYKAMGYYGSLLRVEKFSIPSFDSSKRKNHDVFIAFYEDKVVVLNNYKKVGFLSDFNLRKYIGLTSQDFSKALIISDNLGIYDNGFIYSTLNDKQIYNYSIVEYADVLGRSMSSSDLDSLFSRYKASDSYFDGDDIGDALMFFARVEFEKLSDVEKQKYFDFVIQNNEQFIVSVNDGTIDVGVKFLNYFYTGKREVLFDSKSDGIYNVFYDDFVKNEDVVIKQIDGIPVKFGNIIVSDNDKLLDVNSKIADLNSEFHDVLLSIDNLIYNNSINPIVDFNSNLNNLITIRDNIHDKIGLLMDKKYELESSIDESNIKRHISVINKIEDLLGFRITQIDDYSSNYHFVPSHLSKNLTQLISEKNCIIAELERLYNSGSISFEDYNTMIYELNVEYNDMVSNITDDYSFFDKEVENSGFDKLSAEMGLSVDELERIFVDSDDDEEAEHHRIM